MSSPGDADHRDEGDGTMIGKTIEQLAKGDYARLTRTVDETDIATFVEAVADRGPISSDGVFATPIVPSIFTAALVAAVIGTELPGPGTTYVSQTLKFLKPVHAGDVITAHVGIVEILRARNAVCVQTLCTNQAGEEVLTGEAWVMPPSAPVAATVRTRLELLAPIAV
jgi:acyl dehydratase